MTESNPLTQMFVKGAFSNGIKLLIMDGFNREQITDLFYQYLAAAKTKEEYQKEIDDKAQLEKEERKRRAQEAKANLIPFEKRSELEQKKLTRISEKLGWKIYRVNQRWNTYYTRKSEPHPPIQEALSWFEDELTEEESVKKWRKGYED